mmetsp:Transcript_123712/g.300340  ORF Transcript_123712/g.300340 Transcript_123712/m.300340 type:complete len:161 (+) Transcript_123712:1-483(+)
MSIIYFFTVFASEVWTTVCLPARQKKRAAAKKKKAAEEGMELTDPIGKRVSRAAPGSQRGSGRSSVFMATNPITAGEPASADVGMNPLFAAKAQGGESKGVDESDLSALLEENKRLRKQLQLVQAKGAARQVRRPTQVRAKREFRPAASRTSTEDPKAKA